MNNLILIGLNNFHINNLINYDVVDIKDLISFDTKFQDFEYEKIRNINKGLKSLKYIREGTEFRSEIIKYNLTEFEIASLANIMPGTVDESISLMPNIKRIGNEIIERIVSFFKRFDNMEDDT